ncbi:MAG: c-type cytochrome [Chthoniobacteraceae bacterium]
MKTQHTYEYQRAPRPLTHWMLLLPVVIATSLTGAAAPPPGQLLAAQCAQCHGTNGVAVSGFESIAGKKADDLYKGLLEMSQRRPENIMDLQARAYTPAQLRLIANYLASLPAAAAETLDN